jgi:uncharacterized membrane protein
MEFKNNKSTKVVTLTALLVALVVILQFMGSFIKIGIFSVSLVLVPIVIGASMCGVFSGAFLGFVFGVVVLLSGDAAAFMAINPFGTIITVLLKGTLSGFFAAIVYKLIAPKNKTVAVFSSAVVCPVVNTGIFLIGCLLFFMDTIYSWAGGQDIIKFMVFGLGLMNFPIELLINIVLSPVIVRLLNIKNK